MTARMPMRRLYALATLLAGCSLVDGSDRLDGLYTGVSPETNDIVAHRLTIRESAGGLVSGQIVLRYQGGIGATLPVTGTHRDGVFSLDLQSGNVVIHYTGTTHDGGDELRGVMAYPPGYIVDYSLTLRREAAVGEAE